MVGRLDLGTMELHGKHLIGESLSCAGTSVFSAVDPATGSSLEPTYTDATRAEVDAALALAVRAHRTPVPADKQAGFLEAAAASIDALGDTLAERAQAETGLPVARLTGERGRTVAQLGTFAALVREGSWVDARIDRPLPDRAPVPRPDLRRMLVPLGPVVVFGASNFPLAFSVAGGDTASALAAGCPVVVKGHPSHPGTSELVARAILAAARETGMPEGTFSLVHGRRNEVGEWLVTHPATRAVGFTGSLRGGRALYDLAARRPEPIPVFAEMGSINPVFVLPGAAAVRSDAIATGMAGSVTLGVGQFCTNPGALVVLEGPETERLIDSLAERLADVPAGVMLNEGILRSYHASSRELAEHEGVSPVVTAVSEPDDRALPAAHRTSAKRFLENTALRGEVFGPSTLVVTCEDADEMLEVAVSIEGQLTATIHREPVDDGLAARLAACLVDRVGRLLYDGFPTGVEVSPAMQHGGPYPASTDSRMTSVGTAAIQRFARPVCWQSSPHDLLPEELRDDNPRGLLRQIDGVGTRDPVG
jgi:NADP-dependent aldehyde dehydrogenase